MVQSGGRVKLTPRTRASEVVEVQPNHYQLRRESVWVRCRSNDAMTPRTWHRTRDQSGVIVDKAARALQAQPVAPIDSAANSARV